MGRVGTHNDWDISSVSDGRMLAIRGATCLWSSYDVDPPSIGIRTDTGNDMETGAIPIISADKGLCSYIFNYRLLAMSH